MANTYKLYLSDSKDDFIYRDLEESDIINWYLSEAKAFELFYDSMILCNNYQSRLYELDIEVLISKYDEETEEQFDEYQFFIIDFSCSEELIIKITNLLWNTLYYDNELDLYITWVSDLWTMRTHVETNIKCEEIKEQA